MLLVQCVEFTQRTVQHMRQKAKWLNEKKTCPNVTICAVLPDFGPAVRLGR
jgi:hypothetical protein